MDPAGVEPAKLGTNPNFVTSDRAREHTGVEKNKKPAPEEARVFVVPSSLTRSKVN